MKTNKSDTYRRNLDHRPQSLSTAVVGFLDGAPWKHGALALLSGMAAALAPEPVKAWPLAWVALVPLWVMVRMSAARKNASFWRNGVLGAVWGLGYYGVALMWITGLHPLMWMGVPWLASVAIALFAWTVVTGWGMVWSALWASLFGWLSSRIASSSVGHRSLSTLKRAGAQVLIATALWCAIDWLWVQSFLYWPSLAFTQSPNNLWILQLSQWSGPTTVTAAILAVNGLLAEAVILWLTASSTSAPTSSPTSLKDGRAARLCGAIALILFLSLHLIGGSLFYQPLDSTNREPLNIGIIQGNVPTQIKLYPEGLRRAFKDYTQGYRELVRQGVDAVLTPEGAFPFFWAPPTSTRTSLYQAVLEEKIPLWLGTFVPVGHDFTQSIITLNADGEKVSQYNKIKLVPLGEYIPFAEVLGALVNRLSPLDAYMIPGDTDQQIQTPVGQAILGICYESAFAELFRQQAARGGEFILTASNNDPYNTIMMAQHHAQDVMRAIETDRWAVRATNTGYSGVVDPHGRTMWRSPANVYITHVASIYRRQTRTLYVRHGDWLMLLLTLGAGMVWVRTLALNRRQTPG
ncbi:MAG: apolipoprotein N-acyltransferase [Leptolyngbyaceae bacterium]|nr:apolipoprotein N-acyltransferase [Leptolyngbyaceae bacterium]